MPPPLPRGGLGIPQSLASSPEAPLLGELSAKQTERLDKGQPDREPLLNSTSPSSLTRCHLPYRGEALAFRKALPPRQRLPYQGSCLRSRLRGCTKDSLTGKLLLDSTSPSRLTPCHLPYRGEALAFRKALPPRQRLPLLGELSNEVRLRGWTKDSLTASH